MRQITFLQDFAVHKQGATISIDGMTATSLISRGIAVYAQQAEMPNAATEATSDEAVEVVNDSIVVEKAAAEEEVSPVIEQSLEIPIEEKSTELVEMPAAELPKEEPEKVLSVKQDSKTLKKKVK